MTVKWYIFISLTLLILNTIVQSIDPEIDKDYLRSNRDCGKLPRDTHSRIVNAFPSTERYPWAIGLLRLQESINKKHRYKNSCGGNIITKK